MDNAWKSSDGNLHHCQILERQNVNGLNAKTTHLELTNTTAYRGDICTYSNTYRRGMYYSYDIPVNIVRHKHEYWNKVSSYKCATN